MPSIPPHSSHRLQPLDLTAFVPPKNAFNRESGLFMKARAYEKITHYDLAELFNKAYLRVATMKKGISGFNAVGICPVDPGKFSFDECQVAIKFRTVHVIDAQDEKSDRTESQLETTEQRQHGPPKESQPGTLTESFLETSKEFQPGTSK
jgi:hypothetical protein